MKYFGDNSLAKLIALIKDTLSAHTDDASIHVTAAKKAAWDACEPLIISGDLVKTDLVSTGVSSTGSSVSAGSSQITNLDKTREKVKEAVQAGAPVTCRVNFETVIDLPLVMYYLTDSADIYVFSALAADTPCYAQLYYTDDESSGAFATGSIPMLSDDTPSAPGTASAGTSEKAARADHVHPSERPKATLVTLTAASWDTSTKTKTVEVAGIDADESKQVIYVMPCSADTQAYKDAGIQMSAQAAGKATFTCESVPTSNISVWVVLEDVYDVTPPCLTFSSPSAFSISVASPGWDGTMEYSTDKSTWATWDGAQISATDNGGTYSLDVRGTGNTKVTGTNDTHKWTLTGSNIACEGNIESLLDYATVASGSHPTMASGCYRSMFRGCTSLTTAPALPATALAGDCYSSMFQGCTTLATAPALPATTLAVQCYFYMFSGCTSLTTAPALPATTLETSCYMYMFQDCTSLTTAPALPATTLAFQCYTHMFSGCTGLTTVPELPATTLTGSCYYYMFKNCTSLKLSATQAGNYTKAYRIPTSGTGTTESQALLSMFSGTGGTFAGTPEINTEYYLDASNTIIYTHSLLA